MIQSHHRLDHQRVLDKVGGGRLFDDTPAMRGLGFLLAHPDNLQVMADALHREASK